MIKFLILAIFIYMPSRLDAGAFNNTLPLAGPVSSGGSYVAGPGGIDAMEYNPAVLGVLTSPALVFSYRDYYSLNLLSQKYGAFSLPTGGLNLGFSVNQTATTSEVDFIDWSEEIYTLGAGSDIKGVKGLSAGASFRFFRVVSVENASGYGIDLGALWEPYGFRGLKIGAAARNINSPRISWTSGRDDSLDRIFSAGISYRYKSALIKAGYDRGFNTGIHYDLVPGVFCLRGGFKDYPGPSSKLSGGFGAGYGNYKIEYAFSSHNRLGNTHYFTLKIEMGRRI